MVSGIIICCKINSRYTIIIKQLKDLLAVKFHSLKRPQEYALLLNVSSVYLNEAVKKTTGYKCLCTEKRFNGNA